ncbi:hypothetical protein FRC04_009649 [Tulasnella sp. 424]|nr:hypothetical protein FRC04_009649 [Tulasnella sp. 424]KAG8975947.1 hypothetical protein FRC05_004878 [Tulasnella sp. 425]
MAQDSNSAGAEAQSNLINSNGRSFQELNDAYKLPTDSGEHSRLDLQHEMIKLMLEGSIYQTPEVVKAALSSRENFKRRVLDVGAGSGRWAIDIAEEFPHVDVLGIDLALPNVLTDSNRRVPSNCSFRVADANKDMGKIDSTYDLIQLRCVEVGILDSDLLFFEAARVLRPGGILLLVDAYPQLLDGTGKIIPLQKPGDEGILENNPNYSNVRVQEILVPTGPWPNNLSDTKRKVAETMQQNLLRLLPAFKAILLRDKGLSEEFVNDLAEGAMKEIRELSPAAHGYFKWVFATAVRTESPWVARTDPWQAPEGYDMYDYIVRPLPKE